MKDKSGLQFLTIFGVMLVFVVIIGSVFYIFNTQKKIVEEKKSVDSDKSAITASEPQKFTANNQDWSIEYPADWYIDSDPNFDFVTLSKEKLTSQDTEPFVIFISKFNEGQISDLIDNSLKSLENAKITTVHNDSVVGTQIEGAIATGAVHKLPPGTYSIETYFVMPDDSVVEIRTNNESYLAVYQSIVNSFAALSSAPDTNIEVYEPREGEIISSPFSLSGRARVFENTLNYILLDDDGQVIIEGYTTANAPDIGQFGDFTKEVPFVTTAQSGTLQVFQYSAKDGSKDDLVEISVKFK